MPEPGREPYGLRGKKEKSKKRWLLIPLLLVFASITSFLAGTHVGRSTDQHLGQMLDTIILSPDSGQADKNRIEFSGQVLYTDGAPCSNQKIELHSDPMRTTTDSEGFFHFTDVEIGEHRLTILDENDSPVSEMKVKIERDQEVKAGQIRGTVDSCRLSVAENVIRVHVQLRLDDSKTLSIEPEVYTKDQSGLCMDSDGREVSPSLLEKNMGFTGQEPKQEPPVSGENMMDPENAAAPGPLQARPETGASGIGSAPVLGSSPGTSDPGSAPTPGMSPGTGDAGSTEASIGTVPGTSGSGSPGGGNSGNSDGGSGTKPKPTDPTASEPSPTDPVPTSPSETDPSPTEPQPTEPIPTDPAPTEPTPTEPTPTEPTPTEPVPTEPEEPLNVTVQEKAGPVWTQQTVISLFANRTGAGPSRKLMPGSKGSYEFLVSNQNSYGITYKMELSAPDGQLLLPLRYRLKSGGAYLCGGSKNWLDAGELSAASVTLPAGEEKEYLLEWQWMFEGGDDDLDTRIGSADHLEYEVIVTIRIEQLIV